MKNLCQLIEDGEFCGYCEAPWHKCRCLEKMSDDYWGDNPDHHEQRRPADWQLYKIWTY